jgi:uncharacterized membrane-anchored protein YhcB (DUF1043 family)
MDPLTIALGLLTNRWTQLAMIAVACFVVGDIRGCASQKQETDKMEAKYDTERSHFETYKRESEQRFSELSKESALQNALSEHNLTDLHHNLEVARSALDKELARYDALLKSIRVPSAAVRVLNKSAGGLSEDRQAESKPDSTIATEPSKETSGTDHSTVGLDVIFTTIKINNQNHLECVAQVEELQKVYNNVREQFEPRVNQ